MRRASMALAAALLISGCQTCPSLRASWYEHEESSPQQRRVMTLAVLNPGRAAFQPDALVLNPLDERGQGGWTLKLSRTLAPGELRVLQVVDFKNASQEPFPRCRVPVSLAVQCEAGTRWSWAQLDGVLPNFLPQQWVDDCSEPAQAKTR